MIRLLCLVGLLFASCASTTAPRLAPLVLLDVPDSAYSATIGGLGSMPNVVAEAAAEVHDSLYSGPMIDVLVDVLFVDQDQYEQLVGAPGTRVWTTSLAAAQELLAAADRTPGMRVHSPRLMLYPDRRANLSVVNQVAYVSHYEVEANGLSMVADPTLKVATDGQQLDVRASLVGADVALDLTLRIAELQRPFPELAIAVPGMATPATIQAPIAAVQTLTTQATLAHDECLVLVTHVADHPEKRVVTLVHAQRISASDA